MYKDISSVPNNVKTKEIFIPILIIFLALSFKLKPKIEFRVFCILSDISKMIRGFYVNNA